MADSSADELSEKIRQVCQKIDMTADPEISSPHEISTQEGFRCFSQPITSSMGFYRLTFLIWTFLRFFLFYI